MLTDISMQSGDRYVRDALCVAAHQTVHDGVPGDSYQAEMVPFDSVLTSNIRPYDDQHTGATSFYGKKLCSLS